MLATASKIVNSPVNLDFQLLHGSSISQHFENYLASVWNARPSFTWSLGTHICPPSIPLKAVSLQNQSNNSVQSSHQ